ncbi:MAG: YbhN family protein [Vicinamibacterales bacterium]
MSDAHEDVSSGRNRFMTAVRVVVSLALLGLLLSRVDRDALLASVRHASLPWLAIALGVYFVHVLTGAWRWRLLLGAQNVHVPHRELLSSLLVSYFFNNFLPSNIGGDVVRIRDTARPARSKTIATLVILADRVLGVIGLFLVAAVASTVAFETRGTAGAPMLPVWLWAILFAGIAGVAPALLIPTRLTRLLAPLARLHPEWIGARLETLALTLHRFRARPAVLATCFTGAVLVQSLLVAYYLAVVYALNLPVTVWDLAVIVPVSLVVQMLPVSLNGLGLREATFSFYFTRIGLPVHHGVLLSLVAAGLAMLFSLSGAAVYMTRGRTLAARADA